MKKECEDKECIECIEMEELKYKCGTRIAELENALQNLLQASKRIKPSFKDGQLSTNVEALERQIIEAEKILNPT